MKVTRMWHTMFAVKITIVSKVMQMVEPVEVMQMVEPMEGCE